MNKSQSLADEVVINRIYAVRGRKVMLDKDLADLDQVETKQLKRAVRRNGARFLADFMFQLRNKEVTNLRSQIGTSSWGGVRYSPMAFTEQGVAMSSSVLGSERAIMVSIHVIRVFTKMREILLTNKDILLKLEQLERNVSKNSTEIKLIFDCIKQLLSQKMTPQRSIGFKRRDEQ